MIKHRAAGLLLHPTSLPGRFGIGDLGDELIAFLDWAKSAGIRLWQILPLNPPGYGNSPYGCHSSYAGNPLLISPQRLCNDGLLPERALDDVPEFPEASVDFDQVAPFKDQLLRKSFKHFNHRRRNEHHHAMDRFEDDNRWLEDWAVYAALKDRYEGAKWTEWPDGLADREPGRSPGGACAHRRRPPGGGGWPAPGARRAPRSAGDCHRR